MLDNGGVGAAVVGEIQTGDVVLNDIVEDVRAMLARSDDHAGAVVSGVGVSLDGKPVDRDIVGGNVERRGDRAIAQRWRR